MDNEQEQPLFEIELSVNTGEQWGKLLGDELSALLIAGVPEDREETFWVKVNLEPEDAVECMIIQDEDLFARKVNEVLGRNLCPWRVDIQYSAHDGKGVRSVFLLMNTVSLVDIMAFGT